MKKKDAVYLGLDIGTDSVGYAVTDQDYRLKKYHGEPMWGVHLFEAASQSADRRSFRTARRRLDRRQQRIQMLQEIFAKEIAAVDDNFFIRLRESSLFPEDRSTVQNMIFADSDYLDRDYHRQYPTIHHLIVDLMESNQPHDIRLVYLAIAYMMAHRGHFLKEVDKDNVADVLNFQDLYQSFFNYFEEHDMEIPWISDPEAFSEILKSERRITDKTKEFYKLLNAGKAYKKVPESGVPDRSSMIKLLSGGKVAMKELFSKDEYAELDSIALSDDSDKFDQMVLELEDDDAELIFILKNLYDWSVLVDLMQGYDDSLSKAKVAVYNQHKEDLAYLKRFIRRYFPTRYNDIFRIVKSKSPDPNYVAYSMHAKSGKKQDISNLKKINQDDFCKYIKKIVKDCTDLEDEDVPAYQSMMDRLERSTFMPKQVSTENRVIPYQLYYDQLKQILEHATEYLPFLGIEGEDGITPKDKILSIFVFRVPYFVGPLRRDNSQFAWIERKSEERIYPWNFEDVVDLDASEQAFIKRMIGNCTYLPGEKVLPKCSLLYQEFEVLNEINNLSVDSVKLDVTLKQELVRDLFRKQKKVTLKKVREYLQSRGINGEIGGIDITIKSSLSSYHAFKRLLESGTLDLRQVENIIEHITCTENKIRVKRWLKKEYSFLSDDDLRYISSLKFKDFGRLSEKFLTGICENDPVTDGAVSIIDALRNTNENLMQLLSDRHSYLQVIERLQRMYYSENPLTLTERLDQMYIPNAVKRPVMRTLDIVSDIKKICGDPEKIFIEMARGGSPAQRGKRTVSRRDQILEFYKNFPKEEIRQLSEELSGREDRELQSEALYLYFIQMGKCMYTGKRIDINSLKTGIYDIDHIYPRSKVKDDSLSNKVLVLKEENGRKSDTYPISSDIRIKMAPFWGNLHKKGLISDEKYRRLTRFTPFSEEEKWGFINRQLVETRQSTKAVATLLKEYFPDSEIVYVKAGLVSEFRQEFDLLKARSVNDLHHAKDAYLNIVVGNVYNSCFTKRWFSISENYSIKVEAIFKHEQKPGGIVVWKGEESIKQTREIMNKNAVHLTRYAFCRHGGFFDQMPVKAADNPALIPLKANKPVEKYGGYNKSTASFFCMVKYSIGKKTDIMIMPVDLMVAENFMTDHEFSVRYAKENIEKILKKTVLTVSFPLGMRQIKVNTMFSFGGFKACLAGKSSGGKKLGFYPMNSMAMNQDLINNVKRLERFDEKRRDNATLTVNSEYDNITSTGNVELYDYYTSKFAAVPFSIFWSKWGNTMEEQRENFMAFTLEEQVKTLLNICSVLKTNRSGGCDLTSIGGAKNSCVVDASSMLSNWTKYGDVRIIDISASGLFQHTSRNLLELL